MAPRATALTRRSRRLHRSLGALVGLAALLAGLSATVLPNSAAAAPPPATEGLLRLLDQTPFVGADGGTLSLALARSGPLAHPEATVQLTLFGRLLTRFGLESALGGPGPSGAIASTRTLPARCLPGGAAVRVAADVVPLGAATRPQGECGGRVPVLRLDCSADCDGVYPLRITVRGGGTTTSVVSLVTVAARAHAPLQVVWVFRVAGRDHGLAGATTALGALASHPRVPATVDVQGVALAHGLAEPGGAASVAVLRAAVAGSVHELLEEAYVPADLGALRASHLPSEVLRQFELTGVAMTTAGLDTVARPSTRVTVASGPVTPTSIDATAAAHVPHVVLRGSALQTDPSATLSWGAPFRVAGAPGGSTALAADTELSALSDATTADPGLSAAQFLGELAFLHFEAPNLPQPRVVTVLTDATPFVTPTFVDEVLAGLSDDPVLVPITAAAAFSRIPVGANGFPGVWSLAHGPSRAWPHSTVTYIRSLRIRTDALSSAITGGMTPIPRIEGMLLGAERVLPTDVRRDQLDRVLLALEQEQGHFRIYAGPITLTSTGATSIPITVLSTAPYAVTGVLRLSSPRITFPVSELAFSLTGSVSSVRVRARALVNGDLPLSVRFVAPNAHFLLARAMITVRVTGFSVVGLVLTILAIGVLAAWWIRTLRRKHAPR